jgi:predicted choloylglycine hydrolase
MYHPRLKGSHYEMGYHYGEILAKAGQDFNSYIKLTREQIRCGQESLPLYRIYVPELVEEIRDFSDGSRTDFDLMASWLFSMYGFGDIHGCTCFAFHDHEKIILCRNSDMFPELKKTSESVLYMPSGKNVFLGNSTSFIQMEDGMNEHGLAIGINFLMTKDYKPGINTGFIVRAVLENCKSTEDAVELINSLPLCSTQNFILADKKGNLAVIEASPNRIVVRESKDYIVSSNHFIDSTMQSQHNNPESNWYRSYDRYDTAIGAMQNENKDSTYAKQLASGKYGFICQYDKSMNFDTLWSSVYDITNQIVWRAEGNPKKTLYKEDTRLAWGIKKK